MTTLDDTPIPEQPTAAEPSPEWGDEVHGLLTAAACSSRIRTQGLGDKARAALEALTSQLKREQAIAEHEAQIARLRRGRRFGH